MKKRFKLWTLERRQRAAELYSSGMNRSQIAKELQTNVTRVSDALLLLGIKPTKFWIQKVKTWTPTRDSQVCSLYLAGETVAAIAKRFTTNRYHVRRALHRCGIVPHRVSCAGPNNPAWKGGRSIDDDGYVLIYAPSHPHRRKNNTVLEHRLVMERLLGRFLLPSEVVHHRREPKSNNAPSNLRVYSSNAEHLRDELTGRKKT